MRGTGPMQLFQNWIALSAGEITIHWTIPTG